MAENEKKNVPAATKADKPSMWKRITGWFRSVKSECKKVTWAGWKSVRSNSIIVIICVLIISIVIGILDVAFSGAISGLNLII